MPEAAGLAGSGFAGAALGLRCAAMQTFRDRAAAAYDAEHFRRQGHQLVDQLADYLARATRGEGLPVLPWAPPAENVARFPGTFPRSPPESSPPSWSGCSPTRTTCTTRATWDTRCRRPCRWRRCATSSPRCSTTAWRSTRWAPSPPPWSTTWCAGWRASSACRRARAACSPRAARPATSPRCSPRARPRPASTRGTAARTAGPPLAVLVAGDGALLHRARHAGHGLGRGRRHPRARGRALPAARRTRWTARSRPPSRAGRQPIAVVASAGSTATGAFDPLDAVADFCAAPRPLVARRRGARRPRRRSSRSTARQLKGIERADSVVWDAHKMMMMPALVTAVLFRDGRALLRGLRAGGQLPVPRPGHAALERRGPAHARVHQGDDGAQALHVPEPAGHAPLRGLRDGHLRARAPLRRAPPGLGGLRGGGAAGLQHRLLPAHARRAVPASELDALQSRLRERLVTRGDFYLVQTTLPDGGCTCAPPSSTRSPRTRTWTP